MKTFTKIITLTLVSTLITCASSEIKTNIGSYSLMSTKTLQVEVEKLSELGELPFEMGLELLKRWKDA